MIKDKLIKTTALVLTISLSLCLISILFLDSKIALFFSQPEQQPIYYVSREITNIGLASHYFILSIVLFVLFKFLYPRLPLIQKYVSESNAKLIAYWSGFLLKCMILIGILVHIFKVIFGRQRPHLSPQFESMLFEPFNIHWHWQSFPSGHSQVLFTVATVLSLIVPKYTFHFLAAAAVFALTRVTIQQHFLSDTIFGATIGYLGVLWVYHYSKKYS